MAVTYTWTCLLLWISISTQTTIPDAHVTCVFLEECVLPCSFQTDRDEVIRWLKQEVPVHSFQRGGEWSEHEQYAGRTSLFTHLVSRGNASLHLRGCGPRDRGRYKCHVRTSAGVHEAHVIVRVEAPVRALSLELSRLSGYEEVKCTTRHVYPAPHVAWATDPPTAQPLRPITRKLADRQGLYVVESRLRRLNSQSELTYICTVISSYGSQTWTASLREREINGVEGKDLTIPCHAPPYQPKSSVSWSFTNHNEEALILTYDSQSQLSSASAPWEACARLDVLRVPLGDGSLQLVNPVSLEHTGTYTCVYSSPQNTHTEHTGVNISAVTGERMRSHEESRWWIFAVVVAVLALALTGILGYLKVRGDQSKPRKRPEETSEMKPMKETTANERGFSVSSPLNTRETLSTNVNILNPKHVPAAMPETA
ncbi:V-set domain-containing T-cell activation inhibitor 1-like [Oncorhynchus nerka]|uniref:V-set domain-containing T-cell activation inhibitor 1-like n=1 Tax=Oncorhynchus nerka TaxID=8023 RepID=UPI0011325D9E|nr:V-set domain-containing T-cell activation inhibitor 1-like [Oncorhynchus nerka]XP_029516734.1 V-set domain-containing T-cell activation inhibitor 1-like [Oncorhynchus nerka]